MKADVDHYVDLDIYKYEEATVNVVQAMESMEYTHRSAVYRDLDRSYLRGRRSGKVRGVRVYVRSIERLKTLKANQEY